jgi:hypothetical protein
MVAATERACLLGEDLTVNVQKCFDEKDQVVFVLLLHFWLVFG